MVVCDRVLFSFVFFIPKPFAVVYFFFCTTISFLLLHTSNVSFYGIYTSVYVVNFLFRCVALPILRWFCLAFLRPLFMHVVCGCFWRAIFFVLFCSLFTSIVRVLRYLSSNLSTYDQLFSRHLVDCTWFLHISWQFVVRFFVQAWFVFFSLFLYHLLLFI